MGRISLSNSRRRKTLALGIILLFIAGVFVPCSQSSFKQMQQNSLMSSEKTDFSTENGKITCYTFGRTENGKQGIELSSHEAILLFEQLKELNSEMTRNPYSEKTQLLKIGFVDLLDEKGLLPKGVLKESYLSLLNPKWIEQQQTNKKRSISSQPFANRGTCVFCSMGGGGSGILMPLFLLPRPRFTMFWFGDGLSTAANMLTSKGYAAGGVQIGFAFGFMGIGLSYSLPGQSVYGFIGYALLTTTAADYVEHYPPDYAPEIISTEPTDGALNVSVSLSKLSFSIEDPSGDLMSYTVTTDPDIGSGNGNLKPDGMYAIPVHGLQGSTEYKWTLKVSDDVQTIEQTFTFTTEFIAPVVSNPFPADNAQYVPIETMNVSFDLKDYQGDLMDWTVETQPDIGSGSAIGVGDGRYTIIISGLDYFTSYKWFVNVTDGEHWMKKTYIFRTIAENTLVLEPIDDTAIMENHPNDNCGASEEIALRSLSGWEWDLLFKFDLSVIPSNVTIQDASLQAYYYKNWDGNPGGHHVNLYRISSNWNEDTVTWATHPSYVTELSSFALIPSTIEKWILWDVTDDVMMFYNSGTPNYGWRMVDISGGNQCSYLRSKEYSAYHPVLIIGYEP
jgi:hypothetical protein